MVHHVYVDFYKDFWYFHVFLLKNEAEVIEHGREPDYVSKGYASEDAALQEVKVFIKGLYSDTQ